jgi:Protein of unknown function (DUF1759)/Aspartyl protease
MAEEPPKNLPTASQSDNGAKNKLICCLCNKSFKDESKAEYPCMLCNRPCHKKCRENVELANNEYVCTDCPFDDETISESAPDSADFLKMMKALQKKMAAETHKLLEQQKQHFEQQISQLHLQSSQRTYLQALNTTANLNNSQSADMNQSVTVELLAQSLHEMSVNTKLQNKRQEKLDNQAIYAELPVVNNIGLEWANFYELYTKSKDFFENAQNVMRIQKAIKCQKLLQTAGSNLFNERTYHDSIELLNDRYNRPYELLRNELKIVLNKKSPHKNDHAALVEYIMAVQQYSAMQKNLGNINTQSDSGIISQLVDKLPINYRLQWNSVCVEKEKKLVDARTATERNQHTITVMTLSNFLDKDLDALTRFLSTSNTPTEKRSQERSGSFNFSNVHIDPNGKNAWEYKCCLCMSDDHDFFHCNETKKLSGIALVMKLKELKVCFCCLKEGYSGRNHVCAHSPPPECKQPAHKGKYHWWLLCSLRKASIDPREDANINVHSSSYGGRGRGRGNGRYGRGSERNNPMNKHSSELFPVIDNNQDNCHDAHNPPAVANNNNQQQSNVEKIVDHNALLHETNNNTNSNPYAWPTTAYNTPRDYSNHHITGYLGSMSEYYMDRKMNTEVNLLPVVKVSINNSIVAFLLDTGSSISLIEKQIADELQIYGPECPVTLRWSGDQSRADASSRIIKVQAESLQNKSSHTLHLHTFEDLNISKQNFDAEEMQSRYQYLRALSLHSYQKINGVIGQDQAEFLAMTKIFSSDTGDTSYIGVRSPLGDYVMGNRDSARDLYNYLKRNCHHKSSDENADSQASPSFCLHGNFLHTNTNEIIANDKPPIIKDNRIKNLSYPKQGSLSHESKNKVTEKLTNKIHCTSVAFWRHRKKDASISTSKNEEREAIELDNVWNIDPMKDVKTIDVSSTKSGSNGHRKMKRRRI